MQKPCQLIIHIIKRPLLSSLELALPDLRHSPSRIKQCLPVAPIARDVAADLVLPELLPCPGPAEQVAVMPVPEADIDLDHGV